MARNENAARLGWARYSMAVDWVLDTAASIAVLHVSAGRGSERARPLMHAPPYMAPEQLASPERVDQRTDIWTFGVILFELVAGVRPFPAETYAELCALLLATDASPRLTDAAPDAPAGLADVVATCLEKEPTYRFENLAALADALAPFAGPPGLAAAGRIAAIVGHPSARASGVVAAAPSRIRLR